MSFQPFGRQPDHKGNKQVATCAANDLQLPQDRLRVCSDGSMINLRVIA
jgi:hypothetical protein